MTETPTVVSSESLRRAAHGLLLLGVAFVAVLLYAFSSATRLEQGGLAIFLLSYGSPPLLTLGEGIRFLLWSQRPGGWPVVGEARLSRAVIANYHALPVELMGFGPLFAAGFALIAWEFPAASGYWLLSAVCAAAALFGLHLRRTAGRAASSPAS